MGTLTLARTKLYNPRTGQRVRLTATVTPTADGVFNLSSSWGTYARVSRRGGDLHVAFSPTASPPFEHETRVTASGDCTGGRIAWTHRMHLLLTYTRAGAVREVESPDDGLTWGTETTRFAGGDHGDVVANKKRVLRACYQGGKLQATRQEWGEAAPGSPFFLTDDTGADLLVENDCFRLQPDTREGWLLHARIAGEGTSSLWLSGDDGTTWKRQVTLFAGGTQPGLHAGHDGSLLAWARVGTALQTRLRLPGDTAWGAAASVTDHTGTALSVQAVPHSLTLGYEGAKRHLLVTLLTGETQPSDWHSSDDGTSLRRFT